MNWKVLLLTVGTIAIMAMGFRVACAPVGRDSVEKAFEERDFPEGETLLRSSFHAPHDLQWGLVKDRPRTTEVNFIGPFNKTTGVELYREARAGDLTYEVTVGYGKTQYTTIKVRGPKTTQAKNEKQALNILRIDPALAAAFGKESSASFRGGQYYLSPYNSDGPEITCTIYKPQ